MNDFDAPGSLLTATIEAVRSSNKTPVQLCRETGLHPSWILGLLNGRFRNPSVNRVQYLYEYVTGRQLLAGG